MRNEPPARASSARELNAVSRRGLPLPALVVITLLPALIVSAVIVWQHRAGASDLTPVAAAAPALGEVGSTEDAGAETGSASAFVGHAGATPEATPAPIPGPRSLGTPPPEISATSAIVVDDGSLAVLYDKDAYSQRAPASITKMATAILAVERGVLDEPVAADIHYWELALWGGSTMGLEPGDVLTLRDLLYGLMLVSGNDAAQTIATHIAGSEEAFVADMNALAARLGMDATHFMNADGLSQPGHLSSAWDLVLLGRYLMRFPDLREIVGTEEITVFGMRDGLPVEFDLYNQNPLLNYTPGVDGLKTGFTEQSGRTFAFTAEREGHRVYIVLLDSALRAQDAIALVEWAFANHEWPAVPAD
jgi:D-alanyl-D-alanine carboxypeptidase